MKNRRTVESGKLRRPAKRGKMPEGFFGSTGFMYFKFLIVWGLVLVADFMLEFRFEYLWPFWLLIRSVYDSFKYQGLAFSVFFVFIALTSDVICFLFIPIHWLFFAASTYVWVQYVWHAERGVCLPSVSLWLLFVYIEASIRLKELKSIPYHLELCRPFAAHCIGYPVVTLGFGFKSYVSYRMRLRKQKEVARENEFYMELLHQALPKECLSPPLPPIAPSLPIESSIISNGSTLNHLPNGNQSNGTSVHCRKPSMVNVNNQENGRSISLTNGHSVTSNGVTNSPKLNSEYDAKKTSQSGIDKHELQYMEHQIIRKIPSVNDYDEDSDTCDSSHKNTFKDTIAATLALSPKSQSQNNPQTLTTSSAPNSKWNPSSSCNLNSPTVTNGTTANGSTKKQNKNMVTNNLISPRDEMSSRLEADIKKLKADLQASRQVEQELRAQINTLASEDRGAKAEISQLLQDNENLQTKLHNLVTARQQDKQNISLLEKKVLEEKKNKATLETQLSSERKAKKDGEAATTRALAIAAATRATDCTETCKSKRRELENDLKQLKRELKLREEQLRQLDREAQSLRQYKDSHGDTEILMSALSAMQEKNAHLENSLSAETRLKLDLFSALGDTKRQLEISQVVMAKKDKEIDELKSKIAEVMAVMPPTSSSYSFSENSLVNSILFNTSRMGHESPGNSSLESVLSKSLDPNASIYTPKVVPSDL